MGEVWLWPISPSNISLSVIMVWRGILFEQRTVLVHISDSLTADRYYNQVVLTVVQLLVQADFGTLFQQDNDRPYIALRTLNSVNRVTMLPCPADLPDFSPIEPVWDVIERNLHRYHRYIPMRNWVLQWKRFGKE